MKNQFKKTLQALGGSGSSKTDKSKQSKQNKHRQNEADGTSMNEVSKILDEAVDLCVLCGDNNNNSNNKAYDYHNKFTIEMEIIDDETWEEFRDSLPLRERREHRRGRCG